MKPIPLALSEEDAVPGAVVQLKCGGGDMVVVSSDGVEVVCQWLDRKMLREAKFPIVALAPGSAVSKAVVVLPACPECKRYRPADVVYRDEQNEVFS